MADDAKTEARKIAHASNRSENHEVQYWTKEFGISMERLASIIARDRQFCGGGQIVARQVAASTRRPGFKRMPLRIDARELFRTACSPSLVTNVC
jgi:hypothetical protein